MEKSKFEVGNLIDFVCGSGWGTRSQTGIVIEVVDRDLDNKSLLPNNGERFTYHIYGQLTQHYYWVYEREMKWPEDKWEDS